MQYRKRVFALMLAACLLVSILPLPAMAEGEGQVYYCGLHEHSESCYGPLLTCTLEDHTHGDGCWEEARVPVCTLAELPDHSHGDGCYEGETLTCTDTPAHTHGEDCLEAGETVCGYETAHVHGEGCYTVTQVPVCGKHAHESSCYSSQYTTLVCGVESDHVHGEGCLADTTGCTGAEGCGTAAHKNTCPLYVWACDLTLECRASDHGEGCEKAAYEAELANCTESEGCGAAAHKQSCPLHVWTCDKTADCKAEEHAEDCPAGRKAAAQKTFDEMVAALPAPETVDPLDEELLKSIHEQIQAIIDFALENKLYATQDEVTSHPVIAALLEVLAVPADLTGPLDLTTQETVDYLDLQGWSWNADTKTLTLNGFDLSVDSGDAVTVPDGTTILLAAGSVNTITVRGNSYGIKLCGDVTIKSTDPADKGNLIITTPYRGIGYTSEPKDTSESTAVSFENIDLNITANRGINITSGLAGLSFTMSGVTFNGTGSDRLVQAYNDKGNTTFTIDQSTITGDGMLYVYSSAEGTMNIESSTVTVDLIKVGWWNSHMDLASLNVYDSTLILGPAGTSDGMIEVGVNHAVKAAATLTNSKIIGINSGAGSGISVSQKLGAGQTVDTARGELHIDNCTVFFAGVKDITHAETFNHANGDHITSVVYPSAASATSSNGSISISAPQSTVIHADDVAYTTDKDSGLTVSTESGVMTIPAGTGLGVHTGITISSEADMFIEPGHVVTIPGNKKTTVTLCDGTTVQITPAADAPLYIDPDGKIEIPAGAAVKIDDDEAVTVQNSSYIENGVLKTQGESATMPEPSTLIEATYGDEITFTVKITPKQRTLAHNIVGFYLGDTLLGQVPVTYAEDGTGTASLTYHTHGGIIPIQNNNVVTAKFGGNMDWLGSFAAITVKLERKELTVEGLRAVDRTYDGTVAVAVDAADSILNGVIAPDDVMVASATGTMENANVGEGKPVTITAISLSGDDSKWYSVKLPTETIPVTITAKIIADGVTETVNGATITGPATVDEDGVHITEGGSVTVDGETYTVTDGTITVGPDGTTTIPGGASVENGENVTITGPAQIDKDGTVTVTDGGGISNGGTTANVTAGPVTVQPDGTVNVPASSTVAVNGVMVTGPATLGSDGGITVETGGSVKAGDDTYTVTTGPVYLNEDGSVYVPEGSAVTSGGVTYTGPLVITENGIRIIYKIVEGANQTVTKGNYATFRSNAPYGKFASVEVDGSVISKDNYTDKEGSTIVTLKADYIKTLSAGPHILTIVSTDGEASTTFTVKNAAAAAGSSADTDSPKTGDTTNRTLWYALAIIGLLGFAAATLGKKYLHTGKYTTK